MRLVVTSDLHWDPGGRLTSPDQIYDLVGRILEVEPDAVVLAGDITHGVQNFRDCLSAFAPLDSPWAVLPGNHDLWRCENDTETLWSTALPTLTEKAGAVWLDAENLVVGDVVVAGSIAWYDYSAVDPAYARPARELAAIKGQYNADATWMDWERSDVEFAQEVGDALCERLEHASGREDVRAIVVVTHVPLLEEQMTRKPNNPRWGTSNAYFGNLTLGARVLEYDKVNKIVSGHTHCARHAVIERAGRDSVEAWVVGSDYGAPDFVVVDI